MLKEIQSCFKNDQVLYTRHAREEMDAEEFGIIYDKEIEEAIQNGILLKEYPDDRPLPSVLIFGSTSNGRPIHIVSSYDDSEKRAIIITVYEPDPKEWIDSVERRKI
jgi:hypothetical protein